jgi:hypothetical protein
MRLRAVGPAMPSSYDPRMTDLWLAEAAFDQAARLFALGIRYRERAGEHTDAALVAALHALTEERGRVRLETAILDHLASARVAAGDLDDDP